MPQLRHAGTLYLRAVSRRQNALNVALEAHALRDTVHAELVSTRDGGAKDI